MEPVADFFAGNMAFVFFISGLAWFTMGLAIFFATQASSELKLAQSLPWLAAFGILQGIVEWGNMLRLTQVAASGMGLGQFLVPTRVVFLGLSAAFLLKFGVRLVGSTGSGLRWLEVVPPTLFGLWVLSPLFVPALFSTGGWQAAPAGSCLQCHSGLPALSAAADFEPVTTGGEWLSAAEVWARYLLFLPGLILSAVGMWRQGRLLREMGLGHASRDCRTVALIFLADTVFAGLVVSPAPYFPASVLNYHTFVSTLVVPPQVLQGVVAVSSAFFIARVVRVFGMEHERQLEQARRERQQTQELHVRELQRLTHELEERVDARTRSLTTLLESATTLASTLDMDILLERSMARIASVVGSAEAGLLFLYRDETQSLVLRSSFGCASGAPSAISLRPGEAIAGKAFAGRTMILDSDTDKIVQAMANISLTNAKLVESACLCLAAPRNVLAVPLISKGRAIGVLQLANFAQLQDADISLLQGLADQIAMAVDNARLYEEVQSKEQLRARLLEWVINAQEEERRHVARKLHDEAGQVLMAIMLGISAAEQALPSGSETARAKLRDTRDVVAKAASDIRRIVLDLRPDILDNLGLVPALRWYIKNRLGSAGIEGRLEISQMEQRLPPQLEITIFRVMQEAITNILRHSGATTVRIRVEVRDVVVRASVEDNGKGFSVAEVFSPPGPLQGWGLRGARERVSLLGGTFSIDSAPGKGTRLAMSIPLPGTAAF